MRKIISLICLLLPILASADQLEIRENAPDRYVVVKGDTLWDISGRFFKDPWKWPQIWGVNKDSIKDPHWIYPGDTIFLDAARKTLHVGEPVKSESTAGGPSTGVVPGIPPEEANIEESGATKLSPKISVLPSDQSAIPSIPASAIGPFLQKPLVIEESDFDNAPTVFGTLEQRRLVSKSDIIYVKDMPVDKGDSWQIYRPGREFIDPESGESLGYEAIYLGDAAVEKFAEISTLRVTKSVLEINKGDRLIQSAVTLPNNYIPRPPETQISARVISIYGGVEQGGQNSVVTLNKGRRDGLEIGHVLALYQKGEVVDDGLFSSTQLPYYRYGLIFVFRTFEKVSYGLVVETTLPVQVLDAAVTP